MPKLKPICPHCGKATGLIREEAEPMPGHDDPVCDVVMCSNCGVILGVLPIYDDQWDLRVLLDEEVPPEKRCPHRRKTD